MNSPVDIPFLSFIHLNKQSKTPIYLQLSQQLINAIQRQYLMPGSKIPGSRLLAELLGIHRKTVIAALDDLQNQGWIAIYPNKGTYILTKNEFSDHKKRYSPSVSLNSYPIQTAYTFKRSNLLDNPFEKANYEYQFNDGEPDIRLSPLQNLSGLYSASLKRKYISKQFHEHSHSQSNVFFKEQLANYLNSSRGLHISKNNLFTARSVEMTLYILSRILLKTDDTVIVGELSQATTNMIFQQAGAKIKTIPVDNQGLQIHLLEEYLKKNKVRMVYVSPHHHYPTTVNMSVERRIQLMQLAYQYNFILLEDDYAYDFQFDRSTLMPLASGDLSGNVIYVGSFGKWLAPSFSIGFVVAPQQLIEEMNKYLGVLDRQGDLVMEQVLAEMIAEGEIHRHLRKSSKIYQKRRDDFAHLLKSTFKEQIFFERPSGGLAFWITFNQPLPLMSLTKKALKQELFIPKNILFQNRILCAMRLGFGHLNKDEMKESIEILKNCIELL